MHIVVVASGELPSGYQDTVGAVLRGADRVIAADGGLRHCETLGVWPDLLLGDLDSSPPELVARARAANVSVQEHPTGKDATDLELALAVATADGADEVTVVAAFGGRLDHEQATIALLASDRTAQFRVRALDGRRRLWVLRDAIELELAAGTVVSIVPVGGAASSVTTSGLQWPLSGEDLAFGTTRGVSNVVVGSTQHISIAAGVALVIADAFES